MVLDITLFRNPESLAKIRESHNKRYGDDSLIDDIVRNDELWRKTLFTRNQCSKTLNIIKKSFGTKKGKKIKGKDKMVENETPPEDNSNHKDISHILEKLPDIDQVEINELTIEQLKEVSSKIAYIESDLKVKEEEYDRLRSDALRQIGNVLHDSVPHGPTDDQNVTVCEKGDIVKKRLTHSELIEKLGATNYNAGSRIAGNRGYFLKGACVYLAYALQKVALDLLDSKGYEAIQPPSFMNEDVMADVAQLSQFDEELYKVYGGNSEEKNPDSIKYLIATSEQPLTALHAGEKFKASSLPIKYAGISPCFRKEAGRHGKDTSGIFRVHQFDKVEQFIICSSEDDESWRYLEEMIGNAQEFLDLLKIPYRVVNIASGELNLAAAKKYDVEGWFPGSGTYRELVSCSNCTDYHSRNLNIKHTSKTEMNGRFVHMLNATMCAVTRMICIILENYQSDDGVIVPEALKPYMPPRFKETIPFLQ
jgi:seryl-tRNA synthetase